jgi:hypothetical protein
MRGGAATAVPPALGPDRGACAQATGKSSNAAGSHAASTSRASKADTFQQAKNLRRLRFIVITVSGLIVHTARDANSVAAPDRSLRNSIDRSRQNRLTPRRSGRRGKGSTFLASEEEVMRGTRAVIAAAAVGMALLPGRAHAQNNECLVSLSATADGVAPSRGGALVAATADASGFCTFSVTACLNDTTPGTCAAGPITRLRVLGATTAKDLGALQQTLQAQLPTAHRTCTSTTVKVGQTRHERLAMAATTSDGRSDADRVILSCQCAGNAPAFRSTFEGIQKIIFENHGCTQQVCHGSSKQGGLDLSPAGAYQNLFEAPSTESSFNRVQPGDKDRSFLWLKLAAKTAPSQLPPGVEVAGAPMPNSLPALSADELELVRLWIYTGAPQSGTVAGTQPFLNACLAPPEPILIKPLPAPTPGTGVQFVMPPWTLEAHSEHEICFATYYDISSQVPSAFQDPSGTMFRFNVQDLRQDPQSHHLILNRYIGTAADIHDPSFDAWTCNGGEKAGQTCEPTDLSACGSGTCTSAIQQSFACTGFGPAANGANHYSIGGAQQAQVHSELLDGVFAQIPMKGILFWNSHAFNLTDEDTVMHARLNYSFATNTKYPVHAIFDTSKIFAAHTPPYQTGTLCNDFLLPQGARLFNLSSHTHKRGKHFTIALPNGSVIYESFVYNDPVNQTYNPPLAFDSPDPSQRTLHYCSLYNNGVAHDGSPDPETVTRRSRTPESARITVGLCSPTACAAGKIAARCAGVGDDHTCDSAPGANDGSCDACPIKGGESTENEMFILIGSYYIPSPATAPGSNWTAEAADARGRSLSTEVALPPQIGCGSSHAGHGAAHAGHGTH